MSTTDKTPQPLVPIEDRKLVGVYLSGEEYKLLEEAAASEARSLSMTVRLMVREALGMK